MEMLVRYVFHLSSRECVHFYMCLFYSSWLVSLSIPHYLLRRNWWHCSHLCWWYRCMLCVMFARQQESRWSHVRNHWTGGFLSIFAYIPHSLVPRFSKSSMWLISCHLCLNAVSSTWISLAKLTLRHSSKWDYLNGLPRSVIICFVSTSTQAITIGAVYIAMRVVAISNSTHSRSCSLCCFNIPQNHQHYCPHIQLQSRIFTFFTLARDNLVILYSCPRTSLPSVRIGGDRVIWT